MLPTLVGMLRAGVVRAAPPQAPFAAAVLPLEDRRHAGAPSWLGRYLGERLDRALVRAPQAAVLPQETAAAWAMRLGLRADAPVTGEQLRAMGIQVLVQGTTHEVLGLIEIQLQARGADQSWIAPAEGRLRIHLRDDSPTVVLNRLLGVLGKALLPGAPPRDPHPPTNWQDVQQVYTVLADALLPGDRAARPERIAHLRPWSTHPALGGRVQEALAGLMLEQALLHLPEGAGRQRMLTEALQHAAAALRADPLDTRRQALKGELHYFLRQDLEAKTEASVARIRNPLESLAYVVLGLAAGLSSGAANEHISRALALDPFLRTAQRPKGLVAFQGGVLEESLQRWEGLRTKHGKPGGDDNAAGLLAQAIGHFEARRFEEAERILRPLAEREDNDLTPWLYLNRILIELGQPADAVVGLRRLAADNPQEADILHFLGVALLQSDAPAEAAESFRKALAERPDDARSHLGLAEAEMAQARWPAALTALRAALQAQPEQGEVWLKMGIVHLRMENWSAAEAALQQALTLRPDSEEAVRYLAEAREHLKR